MGVEPGTALPGRARELADLTAAVDAAARGPVAVLLRGQAGIGKTALLDAAVAHARLRGHRCVQVQGAEPLLTTHGIDPTGLPEHLRGAPAAPDLRPAAVTALVVALEQLARDRPALIVADDADRADDTWMRLLTTALQSSSARVALLIGARDERYLPWVSPGIVRYEIGPLPEDAAARLLGASPSRRTGDLRRAAGNPLALRLLREPATALPPEFSRRVQALPETTRWLLAHAAVAGDDERITTLTRAAGASPDLRDWAPAERAGLVVVRDGHVRFPHPLIRMAAVAGYPAEQIARAHRELAATTGDAFRRAEHLAHAATGPDETVAAALEDAAAGAIRRTDYPAATRALQLAAELSPDGADAASRYARAVFAAHRSGEPEWALDLYDRALSLTRDPDVTGVAACGAGFALLHLAQPWEAFEVTARAARRGPADTQVALTTVVVAAAAALLSGAPAHREQLPGLLALAGSGAGGPLGESMIPCAEAGLARAAIRAMSDPAGYARTASSPQPAGKGPADLTRTLFAGTIAFLLDDSLTAATELRAAWELGVNFGAPGSTLASFPLLVTALIDGGKWSDAERLLDVAAQRATAVRSPYLSIVVPALRAALRALRGDGPAPPVAGLPTLPGTSLSDSLRERAAGLTALSAGDHARAYAHFRRLFDEDGDPRHYFLGPRSLPQLALSAAGAGHAEQARRILDRCRRAAGDAPGSRMVMLLAHAAALLDETPAAEQWFQKAIEDTQRALHWPLEYAEAQLAFGLWLRTRRRGQLARAHLLPARDTFLRLGAHAHAEQAGKALPPEQPSAGQTANPLDALTPHQRMVAELVAAGLTNKQIAERLHLSPRTVASHLYRLYPELGVRNRHQLRTLLDGGGV
ncbi:putative LuxR-family transcriptional regulator [Actinoplanes missouriensis 431]|uniref:Putative LuxR-family transcriptional regulator n=1 Tax=Actinoplanes missouriensis (strain ATCC 14538 / DSM 43046 / CBS 188.64 / JCM 3121 / NBRC 102363 / NCIMB 12654 / NRRL B-3342 / UNCC 431) TaxID=512565 RepID=I0H5V5_ACTM4|nr:LuxR family transcriptional regulator [Actinoplanes missouriensis]BAL88392.1 putative LuxR-family transcriptional regulator [Actinoplanes missouriensis 431]